MGYRSKQRILNRVILNGRETSEEMFGILSNEENVSQNDFDILFYACQMAEFNNTSDSFMLVTPKPLLGGMRSSTTTMEISVVVPQEDGNNLPQDLLYHSWSYSQRVLHPPTETPVQTRSLFLYL